LGVFAAWAAAAIAMGCSSGETGGGQGGAQGDAASTTTEQATGTGGAAATGVGGSGSGGGAATTSATTSSTTSSSGDGGSSASGGPTCSDGVMNQDETAIDCGGVCPPCPEPYAGSCTGAPGTANECGPNGDDDCCASILVPGGSFNRLNDATYPAAVGDFRMDKYEITVGRFRQFFQAGLGTQASPPEDGSGAHPGLPGSGWDASWNASLKPSQASLSNALACENDLYPVWSNEAGDRETYPVCCVTWWEAFAFCAAEGGRLPTEAEWNYAAAGGSEQRKYPWGDTQIDPSYALYDCTGDGSAPNQCAAGDIGPVGSRSPKGDAKWGHVDMAGSLFEWMIDGWAQTPPVPCEDCATVATSGDRTVRSGNFFLPGSFQRTLSRLRYEPEFRLHCGVGIRCVYDD
jgi:formylglycine-generating enzyme required for sulfatase activity